MGNKNDLGNKEVSFEKAEEFSNRLGLAFFEVSCAEAKNVDFIFDGIAKKMLGKVHPAVNEEHRRDIVENLRHIEYVAPPRSTKTLKIPKTPKSGESDWGCCLACFQSRVITSKFVFHFHLIPSFFSRLLSNVVESLLRVC